MMFVQKQNHITMYIPVIKLYVTINWSRDYLFFSVPLFLHLPIKWIALSSAFLFRQLLEGPWCWRLSVSMSYSNSSQTSPRAETVGHLDLAQNPVVSNQQKRNFMNKLIHWKVKVKRNESLVNISSSLLSFQSNCRHRHE